MTPMGSPFGSMVDLARTRAAEGAEELLYTFLEDGERPGDALTYGEVDRMARAVAAALQRWRLEGERALLLCPPGLDFIAAFFGCLYAGVVAVPAYPPHPARPQRAFPRLQAIAEDATPSVVLSSRALLRVAATIVRGVPGLGKSRWLAMEDVEAGAAENWREPDVTPETLAFLQYTSGSTADPKGVMVRHGNLLSNLASMEAVQEPEAPRVGVSWLPVYHDMGLIEGVLSPLYGRYTAYLMAPTAFMQRPRRWLEAITRYRGTNSGGPNFAWDLCSRRIPRAQREGLDLRSWRTAYNGSEPIRADTLRRFAAAFRNQGFAWRAVFPVYGLAEATLVVTSDRQSDPPVLRQVDPDALGRDRWIERAATELSQPRVSCGRPLPGVTVLIVDPDTRTVAGPDEIGEIWVSGPSVAAGYWNRPEDSEVAFGAYLADTGAGPYLRTGDLGIMRDGRLYVTGRRKDLIIIRGSKYYPQDLELTVEDAHAAVRRGCVAAFAIETPSGEAVVVAAEIEHQRRGSSRPPVATPDIAPAVRDAVARQHGIRLHALALLAPGAVPKTTSGKLRRQATRLAYLAGELVPQAALAGLTSARHAS